MSDPQEIEHWIGLQPVQCVEISKVSATAAEKSADSGVGSHAYNTI
jgi:hypothetical protein